MNKKQGNSGFLTFISTLYVISAILLLGYVCGCCYPSVGDGIRDAVFGMEDSPAVQAFGILADGLERGAPIRQTLTESFLVLAGHES